MTLFLLTALPVQDDDVLHLYIWNNYISDQTAQRFEHYCRCRLKQDYYSDNEEMLAKLEAGAAGYDILVPTGNAVESLVKRGGLPPSTSPCCRTSKTSSRAISTPGSIPATAIPCPMPTP